MLQKNQIKARVKLPLDKFFAAESPEKDFHTFRYPQLALYNALVYFGQKNMDFYTDDAKFLPILSLLSPDEQFCLKILFDDECVLQYRKLTTIREESELEVITNPEAIEFYDFVVELLESETLL